MTSKYSGIILLLFLLFAVSCDQRTDAQEKGRKEVGTDGLIITSEGTSKYYPEYRKAADLLQEEKAAEAILVYQHLCKIEDEDRKTYAFMGLGTAYMVAHDYPEAIKSYNRSLLLNPRNSNSYIGLGSVYYALRDYQTAIRQYELARQTDPGNADSWWGLAISYDEAGQADSAKANASKFLELVPDTKYKMYVRQILSK